MTKKRRKKSNNNKQMLIFIILIFIIIAVVSTLYKKSIKDDNTQDTTEQTMQITESTIEDTTDIEETITEKKNAEISNISIYTINGNIDTYKRQINGDYDVSSDIENIKENVALSNVENKGVIRIDLLGNTAENITVDKILAKDNNISIENISTIEKEKGIIDFTHEYGDDEKNIDEIIYNIEYVKDSNIFLYSIRIKIDKTDEQIQAKSEDIKEENIDTNTIILTEDELIYYDEFEKEKDENVLLEIEPLLVAKFYAQAEIQKDYDLGYTLWVGYNGDDKNKDEYLNLRKSLDSSIDALKNMQNAQFTKIDDNNGYILLNDDKKLLLRKNDRGIWKVLFE